MALTIVQQPAAIHPINGRAILTLSSDNISEPKFRYKIKLEASGVEVGTYYIVPDPNDLGIFNCSPRLRRLVYADIHDGEDYPTTRNCFDRDADKIFMTATTGIKEITITIDESFAIDEDSQAQDQGIDTEVTFWAYPGATKISEGVNPTTGAGIFSAVQKEALVVVSALDPTGFKLVNVTDQDRFCLPWFNDDANAVEVPVWKMVLVLEDGTTTVEDINVATGSYGNGVDDLTYFFCGPKDLSVFTGITAPQRPTAASTWSYYVLQPFNVTAIGAGYIFRRNKRPCKYDHFQLMFTNRHGMWNFGTFYMKSEKTVKVSSGKEYMKQVGSSSEGGGTEFGHNSWDREIVSYGKDPVSQFKLRSDWLSREEASDMESHLYSRDVRVLINGAADPIPVVVKSRTSRDQKFNKLRQFEITIEIAQRHFTL